HSHAGFFEHLQRRDSSARNRTVDYRLTEEKVHEGAFEVELAEVDEGEFVVGAGAEGEGKFFVADEILRVGDGEVGGGQVADEEGLAFFSADQLEGAGEIAGFDLASALTPTLSRSTGRGGKKGTGRGGR